VPITGHDKHMRSSQSVYLFFPKKVNFLVCLQDWNKHNNGASVHLRVAEKFAEQENAFCLASPLLAFSRN